MIPERERDPDDAPPTAPAVGGRLAGEPDDGAVADLDLTDLKCPLPALRTRKALRSLAPGGRLRVSATDPLAGLDVPNAAREEGATVEAQAAHGSVWHFLLRKP